MALRAGYHGIKNIKSSQIMTRSEQEILGAKNLLQNTATTKTVSGITFTINADGSVSASGTATADAVLNLGSISFNRDIDLIASGSIGGGSASNKIYKFYGYIPGQGNKFECYDGDARFTATANSNITVALIVYNGKTVSGVKFYPMIRLASDPDDTYVPYAMTNRELTLDRFEKQSLSSADDLDNVTETGIYSITTSPANTPENKTYVTLIVKHRTDGDITQLITASSTMYARKKGGSPASWGSWYKYTGTQVTPSSLTSASPETRSEEPELTEDEPIVKKTTTRKATKKTEEV